MTVSTYLKDAEFTNKVSSVAAPNRDKLVGEWFFGESEAETIKNRADGLPLVTIGSPTYFDSFARCSGNGSGGGNRFSTQIIPQMEGGLTIVAVARNNSGGSTRQGLGSLCSARNTTLVGLYDQGTETIFYNGVSTASADAAALVEPAFNKWTTVIGVGGRGVYGQLNLWQDGIKSTANANKLGTRVTNGTAPFTLFLDAVASIDIAYLAIYERTVTQQEVDQIYTGVKKMMALRGISL